MATYVMANRRAGLFRDVEKAAAQASVGLALDGLAFGAKPEIVEDNRPEDPFARRVVVLQASPQEIEARRALLPPDVIIEPDIRHFPEAVPPADFLPLDRFDALLVPFDAPVMEPLKLVVTAGGAPAPNAEITLYVRGLGGVVELSGLTNAQGEANFALTPGQQPAAAVVTPTGNFWPMVARGASVAAPIECPALPRDGPLGWHHGTLGVDVFDPDAGKGVRVGVVDTGVGSHASLAHVNLIGVFLNNAQPTDPALGTDVGIHGTHVAATIGARPVAPGDYGGVAPGCDLFGARVYRSAKDGASQADIVNAVDALSRDHSVDLINLSLGTGTPSQILHDAIIDALERGTLCICAAGNTAGSVLFPAAFPESVAVSALGTAGWGPPGSLTASRLPQDSTRFGRENLFLANFSCFGSEIACAAPGVGIIAAAPSHFGEPSLHAAIDGTSMAGPVVSGALATMLSRNAAYMSTPRVKRRAEAARQLLTAALRDLGLAASFQGRGAPSLLVPTV